MITDTQGVVQMSSPPNPKGLSVFGRPPPIIRKTRRSGHQEFVLTNSVRGPPEHNFMSNDPR